MKYARRQTTSAVVALACIFAVSCGDTGNSMRAAKQRTELNGKVEAPASLEDGVYPVVLADKELPTDRDFKVVELVTIPLAGGVDSIPETTRVIDQPIVLLRNVSHYNRG